MLIGEYSYAIDDKGRLNFPPKFREAMGGTFIVTRWLDDCLVAFPEDEWERISALLSEKSMVKSRDVQRFLYATAVEASPDKQGRILLPANLRQHAKLEKDVTVIGVGRHAEIWNTQAWQQMNERLRSGPIAAAIERAREKAPIETTGQLVEVIRGAMPAAALREKQHPAKRSFQGIRIAVNDELTAISRMLQGAIPRLNAGGRLAVISFHSLEDRIVKSELAAAAKGCDCPPSFPVCVCGKKPLVKLVPRKPILPSAQELEENPRARSAKLRVAEKLPE